MTVAGWLLLLALLVSAGATQVLDSSAAFSTSVPGELQYSCVGHVIEREEQLAAALARGSPAERVAAARELWAGHSRPHARAILRLVVGPPLESPDFPALKRDVEAGIAPAAVLRGLRGGDYRWAAWLAFLRPHPDFVPELLTALKARPGETAETLLALGGSGDRRVLDPLLAVLKGGSRTAGDAAQALGFLGLTDAEPALIDALKDDGWVGLNASQALGRVGTRKALPALEAIANSKGYTGALDVRGVAMAAVVAIERRVNQPGPARDPARQPKPVATLTGHEAFVWALAFAPDGRTLATASDDRTVRLWDPVTGRNDATFQGHARQMSHVAFTPDGMVLATAGWGGDGGVRLLNAVTGRPIRTLGTADRSIDGFAVSADGKYVAVQEYGGDGRVTRLWDPATGQPTATLAGAGGVLAFSPDGKLLVSTDAEATENVQLWDVSARRVVVTLRGHTEGAEAAAFSPDGRTLVTGGDWTVRAWDARTGEPIWTRRVGPRAQHVAVSPDGRLVAAGDYEAVRVLDAGTGAVVAVLPGRGPVAFSPRGGRLAARAADDKLVTVWAFPDGEAGRK